MLSSESISKRGSPHLRRTLFQVVDVILKDSLEDEPVYQFLDKKCAEGKPYKVYMMAAANKFLRICYAKVNKVINAWFVHLTIVVIVEKILLRRSVLLYLFFNPKIHKKFRKIYHFRG